MENLLVAYIDVYKDFINFNNLILLLLINIEAYNKNITNIVQNFAHHACQNSLSNLSFYHNSSKEPKTHLFLSNF